MSTIKPRTTSIVIYQGDDMPRLAELHRAAETARRFEEEEARQLEAARDLFAESPRAGDDYAAELQSHEAAKAETKAREDEYDAFVDEAAERATEIKVRAIGRKRFRDLMADHGPRKVKVKDDPPPGSPEGTPPVEREEDHPDDVRFGVNSETFPMALLTFMDPADPEVRTIAEPQFATSKAVQDFLDNDLAEGDFPGLWTAAYYLNRMPSADPKLSRYSAERRSSDAT